MEMELKNQKVLHNTKVVCRMMGDILLKVRIPMKAKSTTVLPRFMMSNNNNRMIKIFLSKFKMKQVRRQLKIHNRLKFKSVIKMVLKIKMEIQRGVKSNNLNQQKRSKNKTKKSESPKFPSRSTTQYKQFHLTKLISNHK